MRVKLNGVCAEPGEAYSSSQGCLERCIDRPTVEMQSLHRHTDSESDEQAAHVRLVVERYRYM